MLFGKHFAFSVVMAVHNTEGYVREAIESVIAQDFGFANIELILIDDASEDGSLAILEEYRNAYPNQIKLIKNARNLGVSASRNRGILEAKGTYISCLDSDDRLEKTAMTKVWKFFSKHKRETHVVSLPIWYFEGRDEAHALNYKFRTSRVIHLEKEPWMIQMHISSSFVKRNVLKKHLFDETMRYGEDAYVLAQIFLEKPFLGVISDSVYFYRSRADESSALQKAKGSKESLVELVPKVYLPLLEQALTKLGRIPEFLQATILYDRIWRMKIKSLVGREDGEELMEVFWKGMDDVLPAIEEDIILHCRFINSFQKEYLLRRKFGRLPDWKIIHLENQSMIFYSDYLVEITKRDKLKIYEKHGKIYGILRTHFPLERIKIALFLGEKELEVNFVDQEESGIWNMGVQVARDLGVECKEDYPKGLKAGDLTCKLQIDDIVRTLDVKVEV